MGGRQTKTGQGTSTGDSTEDPPEVSFDDFEVLRAIGRGTFGKVQHIQAFSALRSTQVFEAFAGRSQNTKGFLKLRKSCRNSGEMPQNSALRNL